MNTHRETLLDAIVTTLAGVASGGVFRSRMEAFAREALPAVVVQPVGEQVESIGKGSVGRRLEFRVEIHARGTPADSIADPVVQAAHAALMADETLGGKVRRLIEQGMAVEFADGDDTAVMVTLTWLAVYATTTSDLSRPI